MAKGDLRKQKRKRGETIARSRRLITGTNTMDSSSSLSCSSLPSGQRFKSELPLDLFVEEVLFRLPLEDVLSCKSVSKEWYSMIHDRFPAHKHLQLQLLKMQHFTHEKYYTGFDNEKLFEEQIERNVDDEYKKKIGFLAAEVVDPHEDEFTMVYKEYNEIDRSITSKSINHHLLSAGSDQLVGSCNGLVCLNRGSYYHLYICNPITRECIFLPDFDSSEEVSEGCCGFGYNSNSNKYKTVMVYEGCCGFGYDCNSNEYKAIRIVCYNRMEHSDKFHGLIQVYTLGSGSGWRDKEVIHHSLLNDHGVLIDGILHWLDSEGYVWGFNLGDESFRVITKLPFDFDVKDCYHKPKLLDVGGWLAVADSYESLVIIWSFRKSKQDQQLNRWSREFTIYGDSEKGMEFEGIGLTIMGELLCSAFYVTLNLYDEFSEPVFKLDGPFIMRRILHVNSLVSLRNIGNEQVKAFPRHEKYEEIEAERRLKLKEDEIMMQISEHELSESTSLPRKVLKL